ncbi:hypothetical protein D0C36_02210 [Mucilaginibacter conchicola]|uniref:Uncharacterized protein n=1 Tax=Mucilaginibacter conchicola TaxID=2303333 RepID=A0A372NXJ9_9SPHI|nr:hypothetical protein [Mucilaginibacter conchicola]RFZ94389.1 hypothetical protein D0C36_02210 [Mucilaginibacter conchicola]
MKYTYIALALLLATTACTSHENKEKNDTTAEKELKDSVKVADSTTIKKDTTGEKKLKDSVKVADSTTAEPVMRPLGQSGKRGG